jgi:hypothetical protein
MPELHLHTGSGAPKSSQLSPTDSNRPALRELWASHHRALIVFSSIILVLIALDAWLMTRRVRYQEEIVRLRAGMSDVERRRTDAILSSSENRLRVIVELARRQAQGDRDLHLTVSIDSGVMTLEREGALLREMPVQVGPERRVGTPPDTMHMAAPRGARTVERVLGERDAWEVPAWVYAERGVPVATDRFVRGALGPAAIVLSGGTVIYAMPGVGPLNDSAYVLPGSVRARVEDIRAVVPNLKPGMTVYFY